MKEKIEVKAFVKADKKRVWDYFTLPQHIINWNFASPQWHCPNAENDLREGGNFTFRMEAKDGSMGFDFAGTYHEIVPGKEIRYSLGDERKVTVTFDENNEGTLVTEIFEPDLQNSLQMQEQGWQAILDNFKKYAESV